MEKIIQKVISAVGGKGNILSCTNCLTRLRLTLKDSRLADHVQLKDITGVFGIVEANGQLQLIIGPGKAQTASNTLNKLIK